MQILYSAELLKSAKTCLTPSTNAIWVKLIKKASPSVPCVKEFVNNRGTTEDEASKRLI